MTFKDTTSSTVRARNEVINEMSGKQMMLNTKTQSSAEARPILRQTNEFWSHTYNKL